MRNTYSGGVTMRPAPDEDEPEQLIVESWNGCSPQVARIRRRDPTQERALFA
jgi:hypothetical protein